MNNIFTIFSEIQSTTKKTEKAAILIRNKDNEDFKTILKWLLNPFVVTGISNKKLHKDVSALQNNPLMDILWSDVMEYLDKNNTGRDVDIAFIQDFLTTKSDEDSKWYEQFITKSLKLGIDAKTVNAIYGKGFIPTFEVQLGTPIDKCKLKLNEPISISRKLNGTRTVFYKGKLYTRSGKEYIGLDHIINSLRAMGITDDTVTDGELLYKNKEGLTDSEAFQVGVGIANSKAESKPELYYCVFDILPAAEFENGKSIKTYFNRKKDLFEFEKKIADDNIKVVEILYEGTDRSKIQYYLDKCENEWDWEGLMVQTDSPYMCRRVKTLMKCKCFYTCDIRCTGVEKGTGKNENTLGAIICDYKGNGIRVGSGFTDEQRNFYWNNTDKIIGSIVEVKYKEESKNKNGGVSLQFPIYVCTRFDKDKESYN